MYQKLPRVNSNTCITSLGKEIWLTLVHSLEILSMSTLGSTWKVKAHRFNLVSHLLKYQEDTNQASDAVFVLPMPLNAQPVAFT